MKQVALSDLATFMGDNVVINQTQTALTISGNASVGGTFTVTGATTLNGGLTMDTDKFVVANTTGNTSIGGTLGVTGLSTLASLAVTNDVTVNTNVFKVDTSNNRVGVKTASPSVSLDVGSATDAMIVPKGTTAQRPSGAAGQFRFNTSLNRFTKNKHRSDFSMISSIITVLYGLTSKLRKRKSNNIITNRI